MNATLELFDNTARRWRLTDEQRNQLVKQGPLREVAARMAAISLGLGALFKEKDEAELEWLWCPRKLLGGDTPLQHLLTGKNGMTKVLLLVEKERGL